MQNNPMLQIMMNANPQFRQFVNTMQNAQNPMELFKQKYGNDPAYPKVMKAIEGKNPQQIQEYTMNVCQSNGII